MAKAANLCFLDTNVLIYAHDASDASKRAVARSLIGGLIRSGEGVISSQVIQEFCNVALKKMAVNIKPEDAEDAVNIMLRPLWRHAPNPDFYVRALRLFKRYSLSYYDSLIVQAALDLGCTTLYSEDLQDGQDFGGVIIVNPFAS